MNKEQKVKQLFNAIDDCDTNQFVNFLTEDVLFRFGNAEPVCGNDEVGEVVNGFFSSIKRIQHDLQEIWEQGDTVICNGNVTYTRHDTTTLCVPFANILKFTENQIRKYLIYVDISELYKES